MTSAVENQKEKILIVHNDQVVHDIIQVLFGDSHILLTADTGKHGLAMAVKDNPDLVILDTNLTDIDGHEVCSRLKSSAETENIPVIFLTETFETQDELAGLDLGAIDYIAKPFNPKILEVRIRNQLSQKRKLNKLEMMSAVDTLTGIPNRRRFEEYMSQEWRRGKRGKYPLSLLMADIDHFKRYNDAHGHQKGDKCLRMVAREIQQHLRRPSDMVARYGGEEFAIILPDTPFDAAVTLANRIRSGVELLNLYYSGSDAFGRVTISIGAATKIHEDGHSITSLIEAADKNLYISKKDGRNRITGCRAT